MAALHVIAIWALFHASWTRLLALAAVHWIVVGFGISLGYHRLLTHRGFKTSRPRWLTIWHWVPMTVVGVLLIVFAGWGMAAWVMCLRIVLGLHVTWLVNSATHMWGGRRFDTRDDSRNSWWVAMLTFGEGWHNNHHAHPVLARHGLAWWELDVSWLTLRLMQATGLVWDVKVAKMGSVTETSGATI